MTARGIDLEITENHVYINGVEVLLADAPVEITPVSRKHVLAATFTVFLNSLIINPENPPEL